MKEDSESIDWNHYADLGEDGMLPVAGFRLLIYIAPDGKQEVDWAWDGDPVVFIGIGALETAKMAMFHEKLHDEEDDG